MSQTAPTTEKGTASITIPAFTPDFVFTTFKRSRTRSMFSYWPLHSSE